MRWMNWLGILIVGAMASAVGAQNLDAERLNAIEAAFGRGSATMPFRQMEKAAFLGITTSPVSPALRQQLKLPKGMGLVLDFVEKGSPADTAGLKRFDVLQKLNDQLLINPPQLAVLVRSFKGGDEITLTIIREAKPLTIPAKLAEKDVPALDELWGTAVEVPFPAPGVPGIELTPELRQMIEQQFQPGAGVITRGQGKSVMKWSDGQQTITIDARGGGTRGTIYLPGEKHVTVTDRAGNTIFDGPFQTEEQRQALPKDIRDRLEQMEKQMSAQRTKDDAAQVLALKAQLRQLEDVHEHLLSEGKNGNHPEVQQIERQMAAIQKQIDDLVGSTGANAAERITIIRGEDGKARAVIAGRTLTMDQLREELRGRVNRGENVKVVLALAPEVPYELAVQVYTVCSEARVRAISFTQATTQPGHND